MKEYQTPSISIYHIENSDILYTSSEANQQLEGADDEVTCDVTMYGWTPDKDETILVCHKKFQILDGDGKSVGNFMGKEYYTAHEFSSQRFICCVTDKRLVLVPEYTSKGVKRAINIGMTLSGADYVTKKVTAYVFLQNYVDSPLVFYRGDIDDTKLSEEYPSLEAPIIILTCKGNNIYLQCQQGLGKAFDVVTSIKQPEIFK